MKGGIKLFFLRSSTQPVSIERRAITIKGHTPISYSAVRFKGRHILDWVELTYNQHYE